MDNAGHEGVSVSKLIIYVVIVLMVVGVIVGFVITAKGKAESTIDDMFSSVDTAELAKYEKYDNKEVTGSDIEQLYTMVKGTDLVIAVAQNASPISDVTKLDKVSSPMCFNLVPDGADDKSVISEVKWDADKGVYTIDKRYSDTGTAKYNHNLAPLSKKGNTYYTKANQKMFASYIYDLDTEEFAGVVFIPIK